MKKRNEKTRTGFGKNKKDGKNPNAKAGFDKTFAAKKRKKETPPQGSLLARMIQRDAEEEQSAYNKAGKSKTGKFEKRTTYSERSNRNQKTGFGDREKPYGQKKRR